MDLQNYVSIKASYKAYVRFIRIELDTLNTPFTKKILDDGGEGPALPRFPSSDGPPAGGRADLFIRG